MVMTDPSTLPAIAKGYVATLWTASLIIMPLVIIAAVVMEQAKAIKGKRTNYTGIFWTSLAVSLFMLVYSSVFMLIPNLCWWTATFMFPEKAWYDLFDRLKAASDAQTAGKISIMDLNVYLFAQEIVMHFFYFIAVAAEDVFLVVRFAFLGVLYILGPLVGVLSIHPTTRKLFWGWAMSVLQVSLWIVVLRALQALVVSAMGNALPEPGAVGTINSIIFSAVLIFMFISVPLITSKIFTGQNIGTAGSLVMGGAMFVVGKTYTAINKLSKKEESRFAGRVGGAARRFSDPGGRSEKQR